VVEQSNTHYSDDERDGVAPTGRFRIYLGSSAGVGKTVAMLDEGERRRTRGADVVIGYVETHQRPFTVERAQAFEAVPRKIVHYRSATFEELDLEGILARAPEVVMIDELAHTNVPGSSAHEKRWQDVYEILENGIGVISTLNVQHIESLADAVETMTGAKVHERVPDHVVRRADQIELVDSSPEQLRRRLMHGNIYQKEKIADALTNFFRLENLTALRDLALRFVADETEDEMLTYLERLGDHRRWETRERILVAVTGAEGSEQVMHRAARIASRTKGELHVAHVRATDEPQRTTATDLERLKVLAESLNGQWVLLEGDSLANTLVEYALRSRITQLVVGSSGEHKWRSLRGGSLLQRLIRAAGDGGIDVHIIARRSEVAPQPSVRQQR
jgi:two-component system sensor histidine kinase KdpD